MDPLLHDTCIGMQHTPPKRSCTLLVKQHGAGAVLTQLCTLCLLQLPLWCYSAIANFSWQYFVIQHTLMYSWIRCSSVAKHLQFIRDTAEPRLFATSRCPLIEDHYVREYNGPDTHTHCVVQLDWLQQYAKAHANHQKHSTTMAGLGQSRQLILGYMMQCGP
jgi:hypothetical protein